MTTEDESARPQRLVLINLDPRVWRLLKRWLWIGLIAGVTCWLAIIVREIWVPLIIAFLIAMVLDPVVDRMEGRGWSRTSSSVLIYLAAFAVLAAVLYFAVPIMARQAAAISTEF